MKLYKVKVNGKVYEVELESVKESSASIEAPKAAAPASASSAAPASGEGKKVLAPIGGKVIDIKVSVGSRVNKGDCLVVIEAMKLENEVVAPCAGTVKEIQVTKGATVANKDLLVVIG